MVFNGDRTRIFGALVAALAGEEMQNSKITEKTAMNGIICVKLRGLSSVRGHLRRGSPRLLVY